MAMRLGQPVTAVKTAIYGAALIAGNSEPAIERAFGGAVNLADETTKKYRIPFWPRLASAAWGPGSTRLQHIQKGRPETFGLLLGHARRAFHVRQ